MSLLLIRWSAVLFYKALPTGPSSPPKALKSADFPRVSALVSWFVRRETVAAPAKQKLLAVAMNADFQRIVTACVAGRLTCAHSARTAGTPSRAHAEHAGDEQRREARGVIR